MLREGARREARSRGQEYEQEQEQKQRQKQRQRQEIDKKERIERKTKRQDLKKVAVVKVLEGDDIHTDYAALVVAQSGKLSAEER